MAREEDVPESSSSSSIHSKLRRDEKRETGRVSLLQHSPGAQLSKYRVFEPQALAPTRFVVSLSQRKMNKT
jgi:hypothetical protein